MFWLRVYLICVLVVLVQSTSTKIARKNVLLSRRKRYLTFPSGSNFGLSFAFVSNFQIVQPRNWKMLAECDFPFALPSDTRLFKFHKLMRRRSVERNEILSSLESALTRNEINGTACVHKMICESQRFREVKGKSLVQDILYEVFKSEEADLGIDYENVCRQVNFEECPIPLLDFIIGSMSTRA